MLIKRAENTMAFFKAGLLGFQGSGKTFTATRIAIGICRATGGKSICFFDTETGSDFLIPMVKGEQIEPYQVKSRAFSDLLQVIDECEKEKITVLIIDSITHVWRELCESYDKKLQRKGRLQFQDWAKIKAEWGRYTDKYINSNLHIIVCGRAGYEYDYDYNEDGSKDLIKTDIKMKVESEFGFEPSLVVLMERTSENKESIKEHLGKADKKSKDLKQTNKPEAKSRWIHRAHVLKDRTNEINGHTFDYPGFDDFLPHFRALNIGGSHIGVDTTRNSEERFDKQGRTDWERSRMLKTICLEEIQGAMVKLWPGQSVAEKTAKGDFIDAVFGTRSWTAVEERTLKELEYVVSNLKRFEEVYKIGDGIADIWDAIIMKEFNQEESLKLDMEAANADR